MELKDLAGWRMEKGKITRTFKFGSFREAIGFIVRIAFEADEMDHHPEVFNVYDTVEISLQTHDADSKVTGKDVTLAKKIDEIAWV